MGILLGALATLLAGTAGSAEAPVCKDWIVEYEINGKFDIRGTPFNGWDTTLSFGPGRVVLRMPDNDGEPGEGDVRLMEYGHRLAFANSDVSTDMDVRVEPKRCGVVSGTLRQGRLHWSTKVPGYRTHGTVTCTANPLVCALGLLPYKSPVKRDATHAQPLQDFVFTSARTFEMDWMQVPNEDKGKSFIRLLGVEVSRRCVAAPQCK